MAERWADTVTRKSAWTSSIFSAPGLADQKLALDKRRLELAFFLACEELSIISAENEKKLSPYIMFYKLAASPWLLWFKAF